MYNLPQEAVREFMELVQRKQGIELTYKDAEEKAKHLLTLYEMAFSEEVVPQASPTSDKPIT